MSKRMFIDDNFIEPVHKIAEEDLIEFIEDHIITELDKKVIRILPDEWDEFLKKHK